MTGARRPIDDHLDRRPTIGEVEEAMNDPTRIEAELDHGRGYFEVIGLTVQGRLLYVVWVPDGGARRPVHCRQAGRRMKRRYLGGP